MLRRSAATAALVTLALGSPAWPQAGGVFVLAGPPDQPVEIEADRMTYGWETEVLKLEGHVVARRGEGVVRAAAGTLDRAHGMLTLSGGVLGVQGKDVLLADSAVLDLNARSADLNGAVLYLKEQPANPDAPKSGKNSLILHGKRIRQLATGYAAEEVRLTPCDCAGEPDYELFADKATLEGDRARLSGTKLHFLGATVPIFPLALPLTQRQWGLLAPEFSFGGPYTFTYAQPIFIPLGQSNDLTITPGFYTGGSTHGLLNTSNGVTYQVPGARAVKGPRLGLEWRYAPVEGTSGALKLDLYDDLDQHDSTGQPAAFAGERGTADGRGFGGVRGVAHLTHRTERPGFVFAIDGAAATDVMAVRDPLAFALDSLQDMLRTDVGAWSAHGPLTVGADATLMQDMRIDNGLFPDRRLFGAERRATFQRLPGVFAQVAPIPVGPGTFQLEASAVQFESLVGGDPQEQATGFGPTDLGASAGLPARGGLGRSPALRLDLAPRFQIASPASSAFDLRAEAAARVDAWMMEGDPDRDRSRAYALVGASAGLPLERRFGSLLHRVEPQIAVRALSQPLQHGGPPIGDLTDAGGATFASAPDASRQGLAGGVPAARRAYDEIDFAAPDSGAVEATASLAQSLWTKAGRGASRVFQLDLQQDALLWAHDGKARLGEASVVAGGTVGPANLGASLRYDWTLRDLSAFSAGGGAHDSRTDEVHAGLTILNGSSSERLRAGIDELFSAARLDTTPSSLGGNAGVGASVALPKPGLRLGYDFTYIPGVTDIPSFANATHRAMLTYETACHCAGLAVLVSYPFHDTHYLYDHWWRPDFSIRIDLKSLGSFGTF